MAGATIKNPVQGCIVEYLEDNAVQTAFVLDEAGGKLRLILPSKRETKLASARALPWIGPQYPSSFSREEALHALDGHRRRREEKCRDIDPVGLWEIAQGEVEQASADWFAELCENAPDIDVVAAYGRALLACKSHYRFQPPDFLVYDSELVAKRLAEQRARSERDALVAGGAAFLRMLWDAACKKAPFSPEQCGSLPEENILARIRRILMARVANPETQEDAALWQLLSKGLPDAPHLPLQLLMAWGILPQHYNFWLDRADYDSDDSWWREFADDVRTLVGNGSCQSEAAKSVPVCDLPFISIDSPKTRDIDDAFCIERAENGWQLTVALACPAFGWPFGGAFDKKIMRRGTSLYLPEGDLHMLPETLGIGAYSLLAGEERIIFCISLGIDSGGRVTSCRPFLARGILAGNLSFADAQRTIEAYRRDSPLPGVPSDKFAEQLASANELALKREALRISSGAIVMQRPEQRISLTRTDKDIIVELRKEESFRDAQRLVAEMMILASSALADWAVEKKLPLVHRTQNVTVPKEYAGIWSRPEDLAQIMRSLVPSILEIPPRPHAALALSRYAPVTSPLRRYTDLVNEAQALHFLKYGAPRWQEAELQKLLDIFSPSLDSVAQVQKFRPRYWKLLYFRQQGDKVWWDGVITEENENFVTVTLPDQGLIARGRRQQFTERACAGMAVRVRFGKINPLYNEIHIIEVISAD